MIGMGKSRLLDLVLAVAITRQFGGGTKEMQATVHRLRGRMVPEQRPLASKLMRHERIGDWLDLMLEEYADTFAKMQNPPQIPAPPNYDIAHLLGEVEALCVKPGSFVWAEVGKDRRYSYPTIMAAQRRGLVVVKEEEGVYHVSRPPEFYEGVKHDGR